MNIIEKLQNDISIEEIKAVYERGNKLVLKYEDSRMFIGMSDTICFNDEKFSVDTNELKFKEGIKLVGDCIAIDKGYLLEIDSILQADYVLLGLIKPFTGKYEDFTVDFHLYDDDDKLADVVFEIKVS